MRFLCCDLGGTSADWGIYDQRAKDFVFRTSLRTVEFDDFYEMMDHLLAAYASQFKHEISKIQHFVVGVAGPVGAESVRPTNLEGWEVKSITLNSILRDHGHNEKSTIINDFESLAYGVLFKLSTGFSENDFQPIYGRLKTGIVRTGEDIGIRSLVCGPGTGLGIACLVEGLEMAGLPYIISSEGGHQSMAAETSEQYRYLGEGGSFRGKISYEECLSHAGLVEIYNHFRREDYAAEPNYSITSSEVSFLASQGKDQAATDAIELLCEILANFCGNSALAFNADRGVFLWGGVMSKIPVDLLRARFKRLYVDRCKLDDRVAKVPVVLLNDRDLPLLGCAHRASFENKNANTEA
ncbi:MAG: glucokinase [Albidovulum sp.]